MFYGARSDTSSTPETRVQLYECISDAPEQHWTVSGGAIKESFSAGGEDGGFATLGWAAGSKVPSSPGCVTALPVLPPGKPPTPGSAFCPKLHPIHEPTSYAGSQGPPEEGGVYDPSGPLLDAHGTWHVFEDASGWWTSTPGWTHWRSPDLIHWFGNFSDGMGFGKGMTGSVSPTPSGVYAFWPDGENAIFSAKSEDPSAGLTSWSRRNQSIAQPSRVAKYQSRSTGFRDPARAFEFPSGSNEWWVVVGCGSAQECETCPAQPAGCSGKSCVVSAQACLFKANDSTLDTFTDAGSLFSTNTTFGIVDHNIVWQPQNGSASMME